MAGSIKLAFLAVRPLAEGACKAAGFEAGGTAVAAVAGFLEQRFADHSKELTEALHKAHDRAWTAVELSLAGDSWWQSVKSRLATGDQRGFGDQVRAFIQQV